MCDEVPLFNSTMFAWRLQVFRFAITVLCSVFGLLNFFLLLFFVRCRFANLHLRWVNCSIRWVKTISKAGRIEPADCRLMNHLSTNSACGSSAVCPITVYHILFKWFTLFNLPAANVILRQFALRNGLNCCRYRFKLCNVNRRPYGTDTLRLIKRDTHSKK